MEYTTNEPNVLVDFEQELQLEPASMGQRFANFLIDYIVLIIVYVIYSLVFAVSAISSDGYAEEANPFAGYFISILIFVITYTLIEFFGKGKSLGKLITGTRAVRNDGGQLTFKDALVRTLVRLVPFEPFSGFGTYTWHDSWTNTMVKKDR